MFETGVDEMSWDDTVSLFITTLAMLSMHSLVVAASNDLQQSAMALRLRHQHCRMYYNS